MSTGSLETGDGKVCVIPVCRPFCSKVTLACEHCVVESAKETIGSDVMAASDFMSTPFVDRRTETMEGPALFEDRHASMHPSGHLIDE